MDVHKRHSLFNRTQEQASFTVFQPGFFNSELEPESLEDFDFEKAPNHNPTVNTITEEDDPIPHSSGVTYHSVVTSCGSAAPMINQQQPPLPESVEEYDMQPIDQKVLKERPVKNYQIFPGNTRFLCGGRLVTSKDYRAFIIALILFITPAALFCVFTCPFLWNQVHPVIPIVFAYLFILAFASMLKTSWTDPGIIPRNLDIPQQEMIDENASSIHASIMSDIAQKQIRIKNTSWSLRYCETCKIYRPPRASHCRQCDNCVEYEDHHCIWLNNCVGKRNYRPFFIFIVTCVILCIYVIAFDVYYLLSIASNSPNRGFGFVFSQAPVSFVLSIYCFFLLWMVGGLTIYHCSLIMRGVTTHEQLRRDIFKLTYPDLGANPYNKRNPLKNMVQVLCQPQPKSYLRRRKMADPVIEKL
ncbi:Putative Palmitoyltransferase [Rhizopus microsporus]|nr:Putative Palmitoyltransferase [Rhizopus microsporus]